MFTEIVAILLSFKPSVLDKGETLEERTQRFTIAAHAIEEIADLVTCTNRPFRYIKLHSDRYLVAGILVAQLYYESALRRDVWIGHCLHKWDCDYGKAMGPFQLQQRITDSDEVWRGFAGTDQASFERGAWRTITLWIGGAAQGDPTCGFSRLAGILGCDPGKSPTGKKYGIDRWKLSQNIANRLRKK